MRTSDFDREWRRGMIFHRVVFGMILAIWAVVLVSIALMIATVVRLGPEGIAKEVGRLSALALQPTIEVMKEPADE